MSDLLECGLPESELELMHNGKRVGLKLFLRSPDDPAVRKARRLMEGRMTRIYARRLVAQTKTVDPSEGEANVDPTAPLADDSGDEEWGDMGYQGREATVKAAVKGWEWTKDDKGELGCWRKERPDYDVLILGDMIDASPCDIVAQVDAHLTAQALAEKKSKERSPKQSG